ncbi:MAG: response regulator [Deltaproteobacteria bacterium]|nr:response regulator [Deltaproteobacteria bacterium]
MSQAALLVEDNSSHAELIADELELALDGWALDQVPTLAEARAKIASRAYDLFVFDFRLPDGDGIELLREVHAQGIATPTIFVTTASSAKLAVDAMKLGADDYLVKEEGYLAVLPYLVQEVLKRRQLASERQLLEERLQRAERAATLGYLASGLAHHINNPLATIRTFLQLLPTNIEDVEFRTKYLEMALAESERIRDLVKDIMRAATVPQQGHEVKRLNELVEHAESSVAGEMQKRGIVLTKRMEAALPAVRVHGEAATCLLLTLLQNAVRFAPEGSEIEIDARRDAASRRIVVEVRDHGPGVPSENRDKIFEPFFTTAVDGLGMGLFVASRIADLQDIELQLMPTPSQGGAVFRVGFKEAVADAADQPPVAVAV